MKGQSAVEYITTYGWAIFALVLILALIAGSGMFTPDFFISEKCELGTNMPCQAAVYNEAGQTKMSLELINGFSYKIKISSIDVSLADGSASFADFGGNAYIDSGGSRNFTGVLSDKPLGGNEIKQFTARITYASCAPELEPGCGSNHTITGRVIAKVIPG